MPEKHKYFVAEEGTDAEAAAFAWLTWEFVLKEVAAGVAGWLAGKALSAIFDREKGVDIAQLIALIDQLIQNALRQYDLKLLRRQYRAIVEAVHEFNDNGEDHLLEYADTGVLFVIEGFREYGEPAAELTALAVALKIMTLQEYAKSGGKGGKKAVANFARRILDDMIDLAEARQVRVERAFGGIFVRKADEEPRPSYWYAYNGSLLGGETTRAGAEQARESHRKRDLEAMYEPVRSVAAACGELAGAKAFEVALRHR